MNKKLFALLTSAAIMAASVPAVFADAETVTLNIKPKADKVAAGKTAEFDVTVDAKVQLTTLQFAFSVENGTVEGFDFAKDTKDIQKDLGFDALSFTKDIKEASDDAEPNSILGYTTEFPEATAPSNYALGVLKVTAGESGKITVTTTTNTDKDGNSYKGVACYNIDEYSNFVVNDATVEITSDDQTSSVVDSKTESSKTESKTESSSAADSSKSESSKAADSSKKDAANSSKANTNNTTSNTNTGAASTAAVALAASAAALVVISKKRK